jgi:hypothetical protein
MTLGKLANFSVLQPHLMWYKDRTCLFCGSRFRFPQPRTPPESTTVESLQVLGEAWENLPTLSCLALQGYFLPPTEPSLTPCCRGTAMYQQKRLLGEKE